MREADAGVLGARHGGSLLMPLPLAAVAGIGGAVGGSAGGLFGLLGDHLAANRQFSQAKELQQRQFDFQERMARNPYRRAVKDMRLAGINPMLAAKLGGSGIPPGAAASVGMANSGMGRNVVEGFMRGATAKDELRQQRISTKIKSAEEWKEREQANLVKEQRELTQNQQAESRSRQKLLLEQAEHEWEKAQGQRINNAIQQTVIHSAREMEKLDKTPAGGMLRQVKRAAEAIGAATRIGK